MALGEAFVNVHADLKPFAKDLEKGIKAILRSAEKQIRADQTVSRALSDNLRQGMRSGVSDGVDEGLADGAKKGTKKALTGFQKFFAVLGDFADDGLSALPSEVKAALVLGVAAAAAVVGPLLAGAVSAAITAGAAVGVAGLGVLLATRFRSVNDQFTALGRDLLDQLTASAQPFIEPLLEAAAAIKNAFAGFGDQIDRIFGQAALDIEPLTEGLIGFVQELLPGIQVAVEKARPVIEALAEALPDLAYDIATALAILADGSASATVGLRDILDLIGFLIIAAAVFVRVLSELYFWLRVSTDIMTFNFAAATELLTERTKNAALASGRLTDAQKPLGTALSKTAADAKAAALAISDLITEQQRGVNATIDYEQAIDDLAKSIKEGNRDFRETEENGRRNLRLVEQAIAGAAKQRDIDIARAVASGQATDQIEANYLREISTIERLIGKNVKQKEALSDLLTEARNAPKEVAVKVTTPGLPGATNRVNDYAGAIRRAISAIVAAGAAAAKAPDFASGIGSIISGRTKKYANGGIATSPTNATIAEAGYAEAVIPDPRVKPGRALQLADQFGLTSLIADTMRGAAQVVNVFVGNEKLSQYVDYRIGYSNAMNATAMAQGPRGI